MKNSKTMLYAFSEEDLERIVENVISRVRKTDLTQGSNPSLEDDRLTQKEACALLNISVQSIIKWKKKGLIPYYQIGKCIFYSKSELLEVARNRPEIVKLPND